MENKKEPLVMKMVEGEMVTLPLSEMIEFEQRHKNSKPLTEEEIAERLKETESRMKQFAEQFKDLDLPYPELDIIEVCGTTMVMTPEEAEAWEKYQKEHPLEPKD